MGKMSDKDITACNKAIEQDLDEARMAALKAANCLYRVLRAVPETSEIAEKVYTIRRQMLEIVDTVTELRFSDDEPDETSNVYHSELTTEEVVELMSHPRTCRCPLCEGFAPEEEIE